MSLLRTALTRVSRVHVRPPHLLRYVWIPPSSSVPTRSYASKKRSKHVESTEEPSPEAFVPGSQRIAAGEVYHKAEEHMKSSSDRFRKEVSSLETRASGRVTTNLLAPVRVQLPDHDGRGVRLEEVATVGVRDGTTLVVTVFEDHVRPS